MTDKFTYPESHIGEIRAAIERNDEKAAADAALFLLAAFLHDVRRIADAQQAMAKNMQHSTQHTTGFAFPV